MASITSLPRALPDGSGTFTVTVHSIKETGRFADALIMTADVTHTYYGNGSHNSGQASNEERRSVTFTGPSNKGYPGPAFIWSADREHGDRISQPGRFGDTFGPAWIMAFFLDA